MKGAGVGQTIKHSRIAGQEMEEYEAVLAFWFEEIEPKQWWKFDAEFDARVGQRFSGLLEQAASGEQYGWRGSARGRLAEVIVLDQFSRNLRRGTPGVFAQDPTALALSQEAVAGGALTRLSQAQRQFLLIPYMHSESRLIHERAETLLREHVSDYGLGFELRHKAIIDRFGRYPHRNEILDRASTEEKIEFLKQPRSRF